MITIGSFTFKVWQVWCVLSVLLMIMIGRQRYTLSAHLNVKKRLRRIWIIVAALVFAMIDVAVFYSEEKALVLQRVEEFRVMNALGSMTAETVQWASLALLLVVAFICLVLVAFIAANIKKSALKEKRRKQSARRAVRMSNVTPSDEPMDTTVPLDLPERVVVSDVGTLPNMNAK